MKGVLKMNYTDYKKKIEDSRIGKVTLVKFLDKLGLENRGETKMIPFYEWADGEGDVLYITRDRDNEWGDAKDKRCYLLMRVTRMAWVGEAKLKVSDWKVNTGYLDNEQQCKNDRIGDLIKYLNGSELRKLLVFAICGEDWARERCSIWKIV